MIAAEQQILPCFVSMVGALNDTSPMNDARAAHTTRCHFATFSRRVNATEQKLHASYLRLGVQIINVIYTIYALQTCRLSMHITLDDTTPHLVHQTI